MAKSNALRALKSEYVPMNPHVKALIVARFEERMGPHIWPQSPRKKPIKIEISRDPFEDLFKLTPPEGQYG